MQRFLFLLLALGGAALAIAVFAFFAVGLLVGLIVILPVAALGLWLYLRFAPRQPPPRSQVTVIETDYRIEPDPDRRG